MAPLTPHLAMPLRYRAGRFVAVEQGSERHLEDQAEVLVRTRPGMLEASPDVGLRDLAGKLGPVAPELLAALARIDARFGAAESLPGRVRDVVVEIAEEDREG
jgi:hypothetical protein